MLPGLREELSLYPAAPAADGSPAWSLYDPVRNLFFRIDWLSFEILKRWPMSDAQRIAADVAAMTPIDAEADDVETVLSFLYQNQLLAPGGTEYTKRLLGQARAGQQRWWHWLMHRYLFFRVPLWSPDAWLGRHVHRVAFCYRRPFWLASAVAFCLALVLLGREWGTFRATLVDLFTPSALALFGVTLVLVKFLHELGHAFTAKRFGCRVPTMGVAFLVLFPLAYTDVNDAWRLRRRRQRLLVGAAGVLVELLLAVWATLGWFLLPDGALRNALFLVATTTWISTLLVNISPFLRFDGYFLLMDALALPNLHQRSFALTNCWLRRSLFASAEPWPESFAPRKRAALIAFALATWAYRLTVFLGIAWLVYQLFPKPLGPMMAALELFWFILVPLYRGLRDWPEALRSGWSRAAGRRWLWIGSATLLLLALPWSARITTQGLLQPEQVFRVTAPAGAVIEHLAPEGARLSPGETLVRLAVPNLESERLRAGTREAVARWRADVSGIDAALREQRGVFLADSARSAAERLGLEEQLATYTLAAEFAGQFFHSDMDRREGSWVGRGEPLGVLVNGENWLVDGYVEEKDLRRLALGQEARFFPETAGFDPLPLRVTRIEADASRRLGLPMLASLHGGELLVRSSGEMLVPERALYRVSFRVEVMPGWLQTEPRQLRGRVLVFGEREALIARFWRKAMALLVREAGL
jgi:putative peptide zinc metalloprotease protein